MRLREFITLIGGVAAACPLAAHAQQNVGPVIGFLDGQTSDGFSEPLREFRQALKESGYVEGDNLAIEYGWAQNQSWSAALFDSRSRQPSGRCARCNGHPVSARGRGGNGAGCCGLHEGDRSCCRRSRRQPRAARRQQHRLRSLAIHHASES